MQINRGLVFWGVTLITAGAVALAIGRRPSPASAPSMRARVIQAWTTAEIAKPSTSAHQTS